jgi:hypothetical protein
MTENRPGNAQYNATKGSRTNSTYPRVTGNFTGTTDEILQWAACKWGIDEDVVRAQIAVESWWQQTAEGDTSTSCHSFGLGQVRRCYHDSAFEDAVRSSAYNVDYTYAVWRTCFEGGFQWLNTVERGAEYRSGDLEGCLGVWFSGRWRTAEAEQYITKVKSYLQQKIWTTSSFGPAAPRTTTSDPAPTTTAAPTTAAPTTAAPTTAAPTTAAPTTAAPTTAAPTTAAPTTAAPTTAAPSTTAAPTQSPGTFVEAFTGNTGLDRFRTGVYHRNLAVGYASGHGGSWTGDHDLSCGSPDTQRPLRSSASDTNVDEIFYNCKDHMMSSMGDVDGYSVAWFSPNQTFNGQDRVAWDVNVTNLLNRQWWEVAIIPAGAPRVTAIDWLANTAELPSYPAGSVIVGLGPFGGDIHIHSNGSDRNPEWQKICGLDPEGCASKAIRRTWSVTDNHNGTITVRFGDRSYTVPGSFPSGDFEVVFKDHNYTPDKDGTPVGHTWHWDNIIVD